MEQGNDQFEDLVASVSMLVAQTRLSCAFDVSPRQSRRRESRCGVPAATGLPIARTPRVVQYSPTGREQRCDTHRPEPDHAREQDRTRLV
jgi:hypothetical protein